MTCRRAVERMSQALDRPLGWWAAARLASHVWACRHCRRFHRGLRALHAAATDLASDDAPDPGGPALPADARTRLRDRLAAELRRSS